MSDPYLNRTIVYIDSHNKLPSESHNDFTAIVNIDKDVDTVCVLRSTIKKSYYLVQAGYNTFHLREGATTVLVTVPVGNYSASSFRVVLPPILNAASPNGWTYSMSLPNSATSASTGKYTYTVTGNAGVQPSFIFTNNVNECLGFDSDTTQTFVGDSLTSANIVNFQLKDVLRVHSNIVTDSPNNILQELSSSATPDFSSIAYECLDIQANSKPFNIKTNSFRFTILDEDGRHVNLSLNVLITLLFYKKNNIMDRFYSMQMELMRPTTKK